jgi:hypothetical protein
MRRWKQGEQAVIYRPFPGPAFLFCLGEDPSQRRNTWRREWGVRDTLSQRESLLA